jgi:probable O-glycosylation ligase (exosortase A-associated)
MRQLLIFAIIILLVPLSFFAPFTGLVSYVAIAYVRPHEWAYMPSAQFSLAVAMATLLGYAIFEFTQRAPRLIPNALLLLLWLQLTAATFLAQSQDLAVDKLIEFSKTFLIALLMTAMVDSEKRARWVLLGTVLAIGFLAFRSNIGILLTLGQTRIYGPGGAFEDNNDYALLLNVAAPVAFYLARGEKDRLVRIICYTLSAMMMVTVPFTLSRGGFLGLCIVTVGLALKSRYKIIGILAVLLLGALTFVFLPDRVVDRVSTIRTARESDLSARMRFDSWRVSFQIINDHPAFGVGPRNMTEVFGRYLDTGNIRVAHNSYLQMAVDGGLPAMALFLGLILLTFLRLRMARRILKERAPHSPLITYSHGLEIALLAYFVSANFLSRHDLELIYQIIALGTSIASIARRFEREAQNKKQSERVMPALDPAPAAR